MIAWLEDPGSSDADRDRLSVGCTGTCELDADPRGHQLGPNGFTTLHRLAIAGSAANVTLSFRQGDAAMALGSRANVEHRGHLLGWAGAPNRDSSATRVNVLLERMHTLGELHPVHESDG